MIAIYKHWKVYHGEKINRHLGDGTDNSESIVIEKNDAKLLGGFFFFLRFHHINFSESEQEKFRNDIEKGPI